MKFGIEFEAHLALRADSHTRYDGRGDRLASDGEADFRIDPYRMISPNAGAGAGNVAKRASQGLRCAGRIDPGKFDAFMCWSPGLESSILHNRKLQQTIP